MTLLDQETAGTWIARWDAQQEGYVPDREERFTAMIDAVEAAAGRPDPLVLDLGCGPGSLAGRILDRIPGATVVAVDTDPLLLSLGRAVHAGRDGISFTDLDLREPGWAARLRLPRQADAAVSTTALHWISPAGLRVVYAELATLLRPGGLFLNGDNLHVDDVTPGLAGLDGALRERKKARHAAAGARPENWEQWWEAIGADPAFAELRGASSEEVTGHHGSPSRLLSAHADALRAAGFAEVGTLWQHGDNRLLAALLPG
ncbi:class I SAM-dependent methyltransferase [Actinomadura montaniterrae]|uniref:Class I SAM-dependent methyltransferase n=1 Tax=Actinomadura montaniterrae TaxID=1803903 RepID=A0A6L3VGC3_9ACTN|nr:class I SAM-dependent methyltransferase [Actinomadura montaniterrae]KAB2365934.1 class I SAM-dependent methyltransferase [Actinomadura montaniterrae]